MSRLDRVEISVTRGTVAISWDARDALLDRLRGLASAAGIVKAFEDVGASRPVELPVEDVRLLVEAINQWAQDVGTDQLPEGVWGLRGTLVDELHDTDGGP